MAALTSSMASTSTARVCSGKQGKATPLRAQVSVNARMANVVSMGNSSAFAGQSVQRASVACTRRSSRALTQVVYAVKDGATLDRPLRVAVIGGGPSGACAAESLAKVGIETYLLERKLDNCKV